MWQTNHNQQDSISRPSRNSTDGRVRINQSQTSVGHIYTISDGRPFCRSIEMPLIRSRPESVQISYYSFSGSSSSDSPQSSPSDTSAAGLSINNSSSDSQSDVPLGRSPIRRDVPGSPLPASRPFNSPSGLPSGSRTGGPAEAGSLRNVANPRPRTSGPSADDDHQTDSPKRLKMKRRCCMRLIILIAVCAILAGLVAFFMLTSTSLKSELRARFLVRHAVCLSACSSVWVLLLLLLFLLLLLLFYSSVLLNLALPYC